MTNAEVFAAFAARNTAQGGSVRSVRHANGVVLYSYSTPIAYYADSMSLPVFTTRRFSVTTSKQQSQARGACGAFESFPPEDFVTGAKLVGASFSFAR